MVVSSWIDVHSADLSFADHAPVRTVRGDQLSAFYEVANVTSEEVALGST